MLGVFISMWQVASPAHMTADAKYGCGPIYALKTYKQRPLLSALKLTDVRWAK